MQVRCLIVSVRWEIVKKELDHWCHHMGVLQKSLNFSLVAWFWYYPFVGLFRVKSLERFFDFFDVNLIDIILKTWELFLALISFILGWSVYLSGICRIGSCSDESGHLYPLLEIFRTGILIKYSVNLLAIWSSREITWSSLSKLIFRCFVTFLDRSGFAVFQNVLLSSTT